MNRYYFAYGSNLNSRQMSSRCPTARKAGTYLLKGYELEFRYYLTIKPSPGKAVPLGVFTISEDDERRLDRYEGYPTHYRKQALEIEKDGERITGLVYIMNEEIRDVMPPSQSYLDTCLEGYRDFGFDPRYLQEALDNARRK